MDNVHSERSLLEIIRGAINDKSELPDDFSLPHDPDLRIPFADGAKDGVFMYHMGMPEITEETTERIKTALKAASDGDFELADRLFSELGKEFSALALIDRLQQIIGENSDIFSTKNIADFAVKEIVDSRDRECVKFGLSILEMYDIENNEPINKAVLQLALSDEFTLFSLFIISHWKKANDYCFILAKKVRGWGRIHAIERLEPASEEIKTWLLREGVHNKVMPSYTALTCWNKSGIGERSGENLSDEDFCGKVDIIDALLDEGPCSGISEIKNNADVIMDFLESTKSRSIDIRVYETINNIRSYYEDKNQDVVDLCRQILFTPSCRNAVIEAVKKGKNIELARLIGIDYRADILNLMENDFEKNCHLCRFIIDDSEYRAKAIAMFCEKLPLGEMKAPPVNNLGFGEEFKNENMLGWIIQELSNYPSEGVKLIETALQCALTRSRNFALRALQAWVEITKTPLERLQPDIFSVIRELEKTEPDEKLRERIKQLINE